ncbi:MAG: glutamate formimidoyltransferase [Ignavibacteriaceae bacterium]|nr:glutamate formimidoyltransferase [Ignavibacteriaceae bacterium]
MMPEKIIECVPNFSEGKNPDIIKQITDAITGVEGINLLNVDPGADMNRTVVTFTGSPEAVGEAAFRGIKKAAELIDMSVHKGSHPRMGATDVCPFIPVAGVSEQEAIKLSHDVARRVGEELGIPVYLYEKSAPSPERSNLAIIRAGEYEGLQEKMKKPEWKPDYGPGEFNARAGATVMGVREFLIAYNISLNTREVRYATDIAFELREKGRSARKQNGDTRFYNKSEEILKYEAGSYPTGLDDFTGKTIDETAEYCKSKFGYDLKELLVLNNIDPEKPEGESVKIPGKFKYCKAIGWAVPEYDRVQISINLTNFKVTSMHHVLDETRRLAEQRGLVVTGSEIVGMVPFDALYETGIHYLAKQGRCTGIPWRDVLKTAVQSLQLNDVSSFNIDERVLGIPKNDPKALVEMKVTDFADEVSRETPAPGGGSIAALSGALGAGLCSMVSNLTAYKKSDNENDAALNSAAVECQSILRDLIRGVDLDTQAFNSYMDALRMPRGNEDEKKKRSAAMEAGLKKAIEVPMNTALQSLNALKQAQVVVRLGNPNSITDVGVGAVSAFTGVKGGIYNVLINLKGIKDPVYKEETKNQCRKVLQEAETILNEVTSVVEERIWNL